MMPQQTEQVKRELTELRRKAEGFDAAIGIMDIVVAGNGECSSKAREWLVKYGKNSQENKWK
jgi:hypothetical protein